MDSLYLIVIFVLLLGISSIWRKATSGASAAVTPRTCRTTRLNFAMPAAALSVRGRGGMTLAAIDGITPAATERSP